MIHARTHLGPSGFSLIELLVVVVILGVLATIVVPQFAGASAASNQTVFATNVREYAKAAELYRFDTGSYLEDASSGVMPSGFDPYVNAAKWQAPTPIGGVWDSEFEDLGGVTSAVGVHFDGTGTSRGDLYMAEIDRILDDGDLATGRFRSFAADRYYLVIAE